MCVQQRVMLQYLSKRKYLIYEQNVSNISYDMIIIY